MRNTDRLEQLGMPFGTAQNRLRKLILFDLVQRTNQDTCFKCGKKIKTAPELSIEHKTPWLHNSADLFWDLNNIAFSHLKCNKPDRPPGKRIKDIDGKKWCCGHKDYEDIANFWKNGSKKDGYNDLCNNCFNLKRNARRKNKAKK